MMLGTCFGFGVVSELPFAFLREGDGETLRISAAPVSPPGADDALLIDWRPTPERPLAARLYESDGRYKLWISGSGWYWIDPGERRIVVPPEDDPVRREIRLWGIPALLCYLARGDLPLHAAAVEIDGRAVLLAAPRTFGKTTLAAAFHQAGFRVLSEDMTCVRLGAEPSVVPGPAVLRLRRDVADSLDLGRVEVAGADDERVHLSLEPSGRHDCGPRAVRAVVLLSESADGVRLERVAMPEAVRDLWALGFRLPNREAVAEGFRGAAALAASAAVWRLSRPLRLDYLSRTIDRIVADA